MSDVRNLLISGSEKAIGHYRVLLAGARSESERELHRARVARERSGPMPRTMPS